MENSVDQVAGELFDELCNLYDGVKISVHAKKFVDGNAVRHTRKLFVEYDDWGYSDGNLMQRNALEACQKHRKQNTISFKLLDLDAKNERGL